jgi:hypothetical protein
MLPQALFVGPVLFFSLLLEHDVTDFPRAEIRFPHVIDAKIRPKVDYLRLFVSKDKGKTWKHANYFKLDDNVRFEAPEDGLYWFAIQTVFKGGLKTPMEGDFAPTKVYVNTQRRPVIRLHEPEEEVAKQSALPISYLFSCKQFLQISKPCISLVFPPPMMVSRVCCKSRSHSTRRCFFQRQ